MTGFKDTCVRLAHLIAILFMGISVVQAEEPNVESSEVGVLEEDSSGQHLFGNWGGLRTYLEDHGITVDSIVTNDFVANTSGGLKRTGGVLGDFDLTFSIDTQKANLWENGTFFSYFLGVYGRDPLTFVGDIQATDNIESFDTFKLLELWYDHKFLDGKLSVLAGLHDYNSEFYVLDYAGTLINSSFGIPVEISQVGISLYPTTTLGLRVKGTLGEKGYLMAAVYDGVPGDPDHERGTHVKLRKDDGLFYALEGGVLSPEDKPHYKLGLGGWYHTTDFEDFSESLRDDNYGGYVIGEKQLTTESDTSQGLGVFLQNGFAKNDRNQIADYHGLGLTYTGLFEGRDEDVMSLGIAHARNGKDFRNSSDGAKKSETTYELTYRYQVLPYLALQPDVQYVVNPGATHGIDDALVVILRTELAM